MLKSRFHLAALVAIFALIAAACASSSSTSAATGTNSGSTGAGACASVDTSGTDALSVICKNGTIRIATDPKYKPASWYDVKTGSWNGFDVDVANEIAKRLGVSTDIQAHNWDVITAGSWNDRWDLSVGSMTDTVAREKLFDFTPAYYYTPAGVAVAQANTSINDVNPLYFEPLSIALDKNSPVDQATLLAAVSSIVKDMHDDGTLSALSQKWWKTDLTTSNASS